MSLKAFHIFFLLVAIMFDFGMMAYAFFGSENSVTRELRGYGVGLGVIAILLTVYAVWFIRKKAPTIII